MEIKKGAKNIDVLNSPRAMAIMLFFSVQHTINEAVPYAFPSKGSLHYTIKKLQNDSWLNSHKEKNKIYYSTNFKKIAFEFICFIDTTLGVFFKHNLDLINYSKENYSKKNIEDLIDFFTTIFSYSITKQAKDFDEARKRVGKTSYTGIKWVLGSRYEHVHLWLLLNKDKLNLELQNPYLQHLINTLYEDMLDLVGNFDELMLVYHTSKNQNKN